MKVYISGAISGLDFKTVVDNFNNAEKKLQTEGHTTVNPLNNGLEASAEWKVHMRADIKMLLDCEAIYMIDGWRDSKGARIEYNIAEGLGMQIIYQTAVEL